jgi:hypothetical protein
MYIGLYVKCLLLLLHFNETWIFSTDFRKILICQISWKSSSGSLVALWDRQTEEKTNMTKLIVAFRNFANTRKNWPSQQ